MLFFLTCLYVLVFYYQPGGRIPALGAIRFEFLLGTSLLVLLFVLKHKMIFAGERLNRAAVGFFIAMCLSFIGAIQTHTASEAFPVLIGLLKSFSIYLMIICTVDSERRLEKFMWVYVLCLLILVGEPFMLSLQGKNFFPGEGGILRLYGVGQFAHPNGLGTNAVTAVTFLYFLFWHYRSFVVRAFLIGFGLISLRVLMLTASRTAYVGLIILMFYIFLFSKKKIRFAVVTCLLATVLFTSVPNTYRERFLSLREVATTVTSDETQVSSIGGRWNGIRDAWSVFLEYPIFGCGMDSFLRIHPSDRDYGSTGQVHSLLLQIMAETGLVGLVAFSLLAFTIWKILLKTRATLLALNRDEGSFVHCAIQILQVTFLSKLTSGVIAQQILYSQIWWLLGGLVLVSSRFVEEWAQGASAPSIENEIRSPNATLQPIIEP